jgi:hypothetical protein
MKKVKSFKLMDVYVYVNAAVADNFVDALADYA